MVILIQAVKHKERDLASTKTGILQVQRSYKNKDRDLASTKIEISQTQR